MSRDAVICVYCAVIGHYVMPDHIRSVCSGCNCSRYCAVDIVFVLFWESCANSNVFKGSLLALKTIFLEMVVDACALRLLSVTTDLLFCQFKPLYWKGYKRPYKWIVRLYLFWPQCEVQGQAMEQCTWSRHSVQGQEIGNHGLLITHTLHLCCGIECNKGMKYCTSELNY